MRRGPAQFAHGQSGAAAVEFALLLPVALALYIGAVDLGEGMAAQYKTEVAARNVADLASQYATITNPTMSTILGAAGVIVAPFDASGLQVTVSEVTTDSGGAGKVAWSDARNATSLTVGAAAALPAAMQLPNVSVIWAHVTYPYRPSVGPAPIGVISISRDAYFMPRLAASVARTP